VNNALIYVAGVVPAYFSNKREYARNRTTVFFLGQRPETSGVKSWRRFESGITGTDLNQGRRASGSG